MSDDEIITLYQARDENAIRQTDKKYSRFLTTIAFNILRNNEDSSERVNDTYMKAWDTIPPTIPVTLSRYLGRITRGLSIDRLRRKTSGKRGGSEYDLSIDELEECVPDNNTPERSAELSLLTELIDRYLSGCGVDARQMFVCRYYYCDSIKVIAAYFGASEEKIKSTLFRTRAGLREFLEREGFSV